MKCHLSVGKNSIICEKTTLIAEWWKSVITRGNPSSYAPHASASESFLMQLSDLFTLLIAFQQIRDKYTYIFTVFQCNDHHRHSWHYTTNYNMLTRVRGHGTSQNMHKCPYQFNLETFIAKSILQTLALPDIVG